MITAWQVIIADPAVPFLDARLPRRFWSKCIPEPNSGCWLWFGATRNQYARLWIDGAMRSAHRFLLRRLGRLPAEAPDIVVRHRCDTPACVNPAHLEIGSHAENMVDRDTRGRHGNVKITHCPQGHGYADHGVVRNGKRYCKRCQSAASSRKYRSNANRAVKATKCSACSEPGHRKTTCEVARV